MQPQPRALDSLPDDKLATPVNRVQFPDISQQSKLDVDAYGEAKIKYPLKNWNIDGPKDVLLDKPLQAAVLEKANYNFGMDLGLVRDRFKFLQAASATLTVAALLARKHPLTKYAVVPISALWAVTLYHYELGYGEMVNRVQIEAHSLLKER